MLCTSHPTRWWSHPSGRSFLGCPHHSCTLPPPSASLLPALLLPSPPAPPPLPLLPLASGGRWTQTWRGPSDRCSGLLWCQRSSCSPWAQHSCWALRGHRLPEDAGFVIGPDAKPWGRSVWWGLVDSAHWPQWLPWCQRLFLVYYGDRRVERENKGINSSSGYDTVKVDNYHQGVFWHLTLLKGSEGLKKIASNGKKTLKPSYQACPCAKGKSFRWKHQSHWQHRAVCFSWVPLPSNHMLFPQTLLYVPVCVCV